MTGTGLGHVPVEALWVVRANLLAGLDEVAAHIEAGTFHTVGPKGAAPPSQSGQLTLALLRLVELESRP